jgi:LacI family transcriptional regulator
MKKNLQKVVSLGDVAKAAGVSRMTASFALRNKPEVSTKTRTRIARIAKQLGYAPDARIAARMSEVRDTKKRERLPVAWLDLNEVPHLWKTVPYNSPYFEGAKERCEELGYELQEFWLREPGMTPKRLSQILYHRGIQGVIVSPPGHIGLAHLQLSWQFLACASFEKGISAPKMHRVAQDLYYNIMLALKLLRRFGYQRIGVVLQQQTNRRSYHAIQAAVGYFQSTLLRASRIPPVLHVYRNMAGPEFKTWIKKHRPDVIVGHDNRLVQWAEDAGFKVPQEMGVIHLALDNDCLDWAGIFSRKKDIGAATANLVITQIQNNQLGLPDVPMDTMVQGKWQPGKTLLIPRPQK